jgi:hypothetical protein
VALTTSRASIGERLRNARAARGLDLGRVAEDTGIERGVLEALERDAPPHEIHGPVYARIFLREYARHLGLNPKPLVGAYRLAHPEPDRPLIGGPPPVERSPAWWLKPALVLISVAALATMVLMSARDQRTLSAFEPRTLGPSPASPQPASPSPPSTPEPAAGLHLVLRVVDAPCWVRVARGEDVILQATLAPGTVRSFRAPHSLDLALGNAGAARLTVNDESLPAVGGAGEVYVGSLVLRDGRAELTPPA